MPVERRGQVTDVGSEPTGNRRSSNSRREAAAFVRWHEPDDARVSSPDLWVPSRFVLEFDWHGLRLDEDTWSSSKVNRVIGEFLGQALPSVDFAHSDLT